MYVGLYFMQPCILFNMYVRLKYAVDRQVVFQT